jgi:hypothetical protein
MNLTKTIIVLASLVALLAVVAAGAGLLLSGSGAAYEFTTLRGQTAQIYGQGIYQFDTLFSAAGYRGQDATALFLGFPLLVVAIFFYRHGSLPAYSATFYIYMPPWPWAQPSTLFFYSMSPCSPPASSPSYYLSLK